MKRAEENVGKTDQTRYDVTGKPSWLTYDIACTAYSRYILEIGQSEDWMALQAALAPCLLGYGIIAHQLYSDVATKRQGNPYWTWIQNYVADDYVQAVKKGTGRFACSYPRPSVFLSRIA